MEMTAANGFLVTDPALSVDELVGLRAEVSHRLEFLIAEADRTKELVRKNREFTDEGVKARIGDINVLIDRDLQKIETQANKLEAAAASQVEHFAGIAFMRDKDADKALEMQLEGEVRAWFRTLDPVLRKAELQTAAMTGDVLTCRAVCQAPRSFNLATEKEIAEIQEMLVEKRFGDGAGEVSGMRQRKMLARQLRADVKQVRDKLGIMPEIRYQ